MLDRRAVETIFLERLDQPLDPCGNHEAAPRRHPAHRDFERRRIVNAVLEKRRADRQLVEIGQQRDLRGIESEIYRHFSAAAPAAWAASARACLARAPAPRAFLPWGDRAVCRPSAAAADRRDSLSCPADRSFP